MRARDLMTSDPLVVTPTDHVSRAAEIMRATRVGCVPVVQSSESPVLLGLITDRDIAVRCVAKGHDSKCDVKAHMTAGPLQTVGPDADDRNPAHLAGLHFLDHLRDVGVR